MSRIVDVSNSLTSEQRKELSAKIEALEAKYATLHLKSGSQFASGVSSGLNSAWKLINEIDDDYNSEC